MNPDSTLTPSLPSETASVPMYDRDLSWLAFNGRVLQEAEDPTLPLLDRLQFVAIASANLDEFFRVRVATLQAVLRLKKKQRTRFGLAPKSLLTEILARVRTQQETLGRVLRGELLPGLAEAGVALVDERRVSERHRPALLEYFTTTILPLLETIPLDDERLIPFLEDRAIYLAVARHPRLPGTGRRYEPDWSLVRIPSDCLPRFVPLAAVAPATGDEVIFLDDVIRLHLPLLFPDDEIGAAYAVKLSRDAELALHEDLDGDVAERIRRALSKRRTGRPSRFLFDGTAPWGLVQTLAERLDLDQADLISGWRYHHLADLMDFPSFGRDDLRSAPWPPLAHPVLDCGGSPFAAIAAQDQLLLLPYQCFSSVTGFLEAAAVDPEVSAIHVTLYRVASDSAVARALIAAAERGARVTVFVEVQARFDEATNLEWADRMRSAGVRVLTSREGIKVHAKLALVERPAPGESTAQRLAYLSTGNFNEKTARIYTDIGLFTAHPELTAEVAQVFAELEDPASRGEYRHLLVAPHAMRQRFEALVEFEMAEAKAGRPARIMLKLNSLEDPGMVTLLHRASAAGVEIDGIIRGICCLMPGQEESGARLRLRSLVDRFLEHARVYRFHHGGADLVYVGSADWMTRNLDRRVEVVFPLLDPAVANRVRDILALQLADNLRARIIDSEQSNQRVPRGEPPVRAQMALYQRLAAE